MKTIQTALVLLCVVGVPRMVSGQTVISGRAVSAAASPLSGVAVRLVKQQISDTTPSTGLFSLQVPTSVLFRNDQRETPWIAIRGNHIELQLQRTQTLSVFLFDLQGGKVATFLDQELAPGKYDLSTIDRMSHCASGLYILRMSVDRTFSSIKVLLTNGQMNVAIDEQGAGEVLPKLSALNAAADTLYLSKTGYVTTKVAIQTLTTQNVGDVIIQAVGATDPIAVHNTSEDQYDQILIQSVASHGLDSSVAMVIKAQIVIESGFNAQAISMYDVTLPCGSHSYGLLQVTPACETGFATLPSGTAVTATISGGLNGTPAVLTYANQADKTNGNTIVEESGIIIDLVSNSSNPLWSTSAFNPAYEINFGVQAFAGVMSEMKSKYPNCTSANYVSMALAGYNQGSETVAGCTSLGNGQSYATSVLTQYRTFCQQAGITAVY